MHPRENDRLHKSAKCHRALCVVPQVGFHVHQWYRLYRVLRHNSRLIDFCFKSLVGCHTRLLLVNLLGIRLNNDEETGYALNRNSSKIDRTTKRADDQVERELPARE